MMDPKFLLLVEDSDDDAALFARAVSQKRPEIVIERASHAEDARKVLLTRIPHLIVLDCDLPGVGGLELLRELRLDESLRRIPIVMMSGTRSDLDIELCYAFGASSFVSKPFDYREYMDLVVLVLDYWMLANRISLAAQQFEPLASESGASGTRQAVF